MTLNLNQKHICKNVIFSLLIASVSFFYFALPVWFKTIEKDEVGGLIRHNIDSIEDGDGLEIADFNNDGLIDIVVAESKLGKVTWYEQGNNLNKWTPHFIAEGYEKIEGLDVIDADADGRLEVVILDQGLGQVAFAEQDSNDPTGSWSVEVIDAEAYKVQCSLETDLDEDGDTDLIYAYEGLKDGQGGFFWLEFKGSNSLKAENWQKHTLNQINGGWWINQELLDINKDGTKQELVVTSRTLRNEDAVPGAFWLEPNGPVNETWTRHTIEDGKDFYPLHITTGNFTGKNHSNDVVLGAMEKGSGIYLYSYSGGYSRTVIESRGTWHNIKALNLDNTGRDELLAVDSNIIFGRRLHLYSFKEEKSGNGKYQKIWSTRYWKADDRIIPYDLNGDGIDEIITISAMDNSVDWWEVTLGWTPLKWRDILSWGVLIGVASFWFLELFRLIRAFPPRNLNNIAKNSKHNFINLRNA